MTSLLSRLLLLNVAALVPSIGLWASGQPGPLPIAIGAVSGLAIAAAGLWVLLRRPMRRLLEVAERVRLGAEPGGAEFAGAGQEFAALAAAMDACVAARRAREQELRDAQAAAEAGHAVLKEKEERLRFALAVADFGVYELDTVRKCILYDDRAVMITHGVVPAGVWVPLSDARIAMLLSGIHPDDRAVRRAALRAVIEGKVETLSITYRFRSPQGTWRWIAERGRAVLRHGKSRMPTRIVGVLRDVTEQRDTATALTREVAEHTAALRESERRFRGIFDSAFQLTALLTRRGVLLEANRAMLDFLGLPEADVLGRPLCEIGAWAETPEVVEQTKQHVARAAAGKFVRHEMVLRGPGGKPAIFDFSVKPIFDEEGNVTMLVAEARDLTERVQLQAQLAQAQKMEAVGQLTGGVAHDFNNLLQALTGNLDLIHRLAEARGDQRLLRLTENAQRAAARGARLTQQLLAFSRRQNLRPERVMVSDLIAETSELLRRTAGETVDVRTWTADNLWACHVDPAQFESALLNLAINACDAMPNGGTLRISAENVVVDGEQAERLELRPGDYVRVDVIDSGVGIAPEHLPRLFEPFFTTKEAGKGTGLGLAMVHGFARQSGGAVVVQSEVGRGATVSLFLPRDISEAEGTKKSPEPQPHTAFGPSSPALRGRASGLGILVVEDDPEVRDAVEFTLADAGHRVRTATDGNAALELLGGSERFDVLLCDLVLPGGMSGIEIAEAARRKRPELRVLLATGYGADSLVATNGYEVLTKPFSHTELLRRVMGVAVPAPAG